jgi:hypothetical protein
MCQDVCHNDDIDEVLHTGLMVYYVGWPLVLCVCGWLGLLGLAWAVPEAPHEWHEAAVGLSLAQEGVLQQLEGRGALARVPHQHALNEALQHTARLKHTQPLCTRHTHSLITLSILHTPSLATHTHSPYTPHHTFSPPY